MNKPSQIWMCLVSIIAALAAGAARGQEATYTVKAMTPETALKAAQAALRRVPHSPQNLRPASFAVPQAGQFTRGSPSGRQL